MQYVLSKKAKIWGANIHEHVLFRSLEHLDTRTLEGLIAFMKTEALSLIELNSEHMTTFLSLAIVAESADANAKELVRKNEVPQELQLRIERVDRPSIGSYRPFRFLYYHQSSRQRIN